ncbi:MAG: transglutaminase domain-containing protein [Candidatus Competibacteraceae bacterium]
MLRMLRKANFLSWLLVFFLLWHLQWSVVYATELSIPANLPRTSNEVSPETPPKDKADIRFDDLLSELKQALSPESAHARSSEATRTELQSLEAKRTKLQSLKARISDEDAKVREYFRTLDNLITSKGLPEEIRQRHEDFVNDYDAKYKALIAHVDAVNKAGSVDENAYAELQRFLEENTAKPRSRSFDPNNLPHRSLKAEKSIPPKLTEEEWKKAFAKEVSIRAASVAQSTSPTPADLAETIEVKFTPEITQLAADLNNNPVQIYNWVRNNIEFVPTWGSIQGAQLCLEVRICNAFDTSSLLIALLRVSGIPARYQMGTIEVPIDQFMNWAGGFNDPDAAASFASAGTPSVVRRVDETGVVRSVRLEHVWGKAFVDYIPSGGAINTQGDSWVDMDPNFKQYNFPPPVDLNQFVTVTDPVAFLNQAQATANVNPTTGEISNLDLNFIDATLRPDDQAIFDSISANFPNKSVAEILGVGQISLTQSPVLASTVPYQVITQGLEFSEIPAQLRHAIELVLTDLGGNPLLSYANALPQMSYSPLIFSYVPASEADRSALESLFPPESTSLLPGSLPTSSIKVVPKLKLDDQVVASGGAFRLGATHVLELKFTSPTIETPKVVNTITAGEVFAIALDLQRIPGKALSDIANRFQQIADEVTNNPTNPNVSPGKIQELLLQSVALGWFTQADLMNQIAAQNFGVVSLRYPSAAMAFADLSPTTLFGVTIRVAMPGLRMDIDRDIVVTLAKDGANQSSVIHTLLTGIVGSQLEANLPRQIISALNPNAHWVSTTSALANAMTLGDTLVTLTSDNFAAVAPNLDVFPEELVEIQDALNAGMAVSMHETSLVDRAGTRALGLIKFDPLTGSGAFLIGGAGGANPTQCGADVGTGDFLEGTLTSGAGSIATSTLMEILDRPGGRANFVGSVIKLVNFMSNLSKAAQEFTTRTELIPDNAKPMIGLAVLFGALDVLKSLLPGGAAVGTAATAYLNMVSWTAYEMAAQLLGRMAEIEAAERGVLLVPGCLARQATS